MIGGAKDGWRLVAEENFGVASNLAANHQWRSCASRAYYAAFSRVTQGLMEKHLAPRQNFGTWSHAQLPQLAVDHLLSGSAATNLGYAVRRLYRLRLLADYQPHVGFGKAEAFEATGLMTQVFRQLALGETP